MVDFTADKLKQSRDAGYSDDEIWSFLSNQDERFNKSKEAGYSLDEISGFLSQQAKQQEGVPVMEPNPQRDYEISASMVKSLAQARDENYGRYNELSQIPERTPETVAEMVKSFEAGKQAELNLYKEQNTLGKLQSQLAEQEKQRQIAEAKKAKEEKISQDQAAAQAAMVEANKPEEGILRKAADIPVGLLAGTTGVLKSIADTFGADSPASQQFAERERFWNNLISESGKEKQKRAAEIQQAAQDKGVWEQAKAAAQAFTESPTIMLATGAGSLAPFIATAGAGEVLGGGAAAVRGAQIGLGAISGMGSVKGGIYEQVKQEALNAGKTPEEAAKIASEAQSYVENPEQILAGGAIGALASATGLEATAGRAIAKAGRDVALGAGKIIAKNIAEEALTEAPQQLQQRVAQNIASQKAGFDVPTFQGAIGEATTAGIIATALGGIGGSIDAVAASSENAQKVKMAVNTQSAAQQSEDVAPMTASVVVDQAEAVGRQAAADLQTEAEKKLAELQAQAKAGAEITLEEETAQANAPQAQARITEREGQVAEPVEAPQGTRLEAAAYKAPDGTVYFGANHLEAMGKARDAGKIDQAAIDEKQTVASRETPEFGFSTDKEAFIGRSQAEVVASGSGQLKVEQPATGLLHSNEVVLDAFPSGLSAQPVTPTPEAPPVAPAAPVEPVVPAGTPAQPTAVSAPTEPTAPTEAAAEPVPAATPRPAVDVEALSPNAKRANRILTNAGVDPETAAFVSQQYQDEIADLGGEELRAFVLDKFEENGGVIPAQMRYSEDQEYYQMAFGIGPEEAATLVENAKGQNAQMAQAELDQNKQWRRKDEQAKQTQQGVAVAQPEAKAVPVPAGEVTPSPAIEGRGVPTAPETAPVTTTPTEVATTAKPTTLAPTEPVATTVPPTVEAAPEARESRRAAQPTVGMTTDAVRARLEALGFGVEGMIRIVEDPQAAFEGRTIIQDGKAVRIELNASALRDNAAIDRVLNHEFAESANADGALNKLVERLTTKEKKEINDAITRLGYEERVRTTEEAARAIETLAAAWKGRGFFERAVARIQAWGSKLGFKLTRKAAEYIAARNLSDVNAGFKAAYEQSINLATEGNQQVRESRREPAPRFTEESPEAKTLSTMRAAMEKVDAASEAKGGKPATQKISEIAANWMEQGGDTRSLQDAITEFTNLSPANAQKVANAIARQYDIQQSIASAFLETPAGISVEAIPEGATLPKEVDPDRPKPVMQRLFEVFVGVRVPPVKITVNEKTALKQQIRLKAAANRAAKDAQKATADAVVETIKQMELRGPVRPKQALALAKRAARVIWTSEKSVEAFTEYAAKVVENTNYDADVREAKAAQKRAKELSKQKTVAMSPQRQVLEDMGKIAIGSIEDPRLFADTVNYYLRAFKKATSPDYVVIPDSEMTNYLSQLENQEIDANAERERISNEALAAQYGLPVSQVEALLNSQDIIRDLVAYAKREEIESILNQKIGDIQTALKVYDQSQLRPDQRKLVDALLSIDAKGLDAKEKQTIVRIGNNVIYNNQTNGAQYFVAVANGQQNARQAAQDSKTIEKNRAWVDLLPTLGSKKVAEAMRNWSLELQSVADTFRNIFGKEGMAKMFRQMGMYNLDRGFTDAANVLDQIQEKMAEFYKKNSKKYGKAARDQNGILSEGVVGFLIQGVPAKGEQESIAQRRDLIRQDIANRRSSQQKDRVDMANRIEEILNKVDGNTVEEILANMKASYRPNYDSLTYLMNDLLPQYKDFLKQFDENFNDQANNYDNPYYLPIAFVRSGPELEITPESESMFYEAMSLRPRQAANTIKRVDYTKLPTDKSGNPKEIQFNLRRGTYDSLSDQINKAYTNEAWQQIFSFMKTADANAVFGGRANKDFMAERLNRLRISRMRRGSANNGAIAKFADSVSVLARKIGTGIALGGVFQVFKQSPDQLISALGTTGRYDLLGESIGTLKSAKVMLDKFSIGRRGDASSGYKYINQMEGAQNRLERAFTESRWSEVKENASKIADVWMVALKKTDFLCAAGAWMTYYRAQLDKNNIKFEGWDKEAQLVDTDTARQDAASYAEQMTDIYQGSSDPTKMATFAQSGKSGWENLVKAILVPFNSFAIQQRMRIYSDGRDSFTKAGETGAAGRFGLASTLGGLVAFHTMRRLILPTITGAGVYALYAMLGVDMDEPDEEKQKEEARKNWRQFQGELLANTLVGGAPQMVEAATIDAFNYANYLVSLQLESEDIIDDNGEIMDFAKYQKERSPFWRYQSFKNAPSFGMFDVVLGQVEKVALQTKQLTDREQIEMYTPEEQRLLYFSTLSEWLYLMRLNDADFARMVGKARRDMIKAVEDREKSLNAIRNR